MSAPFPSLAMHRDTRAMAWWLVICAAMVFAMVVLGGATRLTESGLSMVEWKPLTVLPPLTAEQWQTEFSNYQQFPEFQKKNGWMTLADFKSIYWLEYSHRLWGRLIGAVFLLPFLWFFYRRAVDRPLAWKLGGLFILGGLQGALGWFMVASGLQDRPDVSQYRLAAHLITAFILYGALIWVALDLFGANRQRSAHDSHFARLALMLPIAVLIVATAGAFVAGLDAGLTYNTFPLMDGRLVPAGALAQEPWYANFFENVATVQFEHRLLAVALVVFVAAIWLRARRAELGRRGRRLTHAVGAMTIIQAALGISTLLLVVPVPLALAHQTGALILFTLSICLAHETRVEHGSLRAASLQPAE
jgi:heme a synthase